ncbi:MAG: hypothetical protein IJ581_06265 [Paludibacteraceae bacterium]|nr:hypothetical protein [Paludibacteraceae bacterium]
MHLLLTILLSTFLRLPANTDSVRAVLYCHQNMTEEVLFRSPYFTAEMDRLGVAMAFVQQGSQNWDTTVIGADRLNCQQRFEALIRRWADSTAHPELTVAPVIPFGHSAQATFPWNFAAWNPGRTLCIISYKGDAPRTNLCGYGRANIEWGRTRNIDSIPALMVMGEYEWWEARLNPARAFRITYPDSRISFLRDAGHGHFDLSLATQHYLVRFIEKSLADPRPASGVEHDGFWYQDREMVALTKAHQRASHGKRPQYVSARLDGSLLPYNPDSHIRIRAQWLTDTLRLEPVFVDSTHTRLSTAHASTTPRVTLISGAAREVAPNTFVRDTAYRGHDPRRLWDGVTFCVEAPGDRRYKPAVREINFQSPQPRIDTVRLGTLQARSGDTIILDPAKYYAGQIQVHNCRDVVIDGRGATLRPDERGFGVEIRNSRNITVRNLITSQVPTGASDSVLIENVRCYSYGPWGDGLNIFASSHVTLRGCYCETSDDCMTVYATRKGYAGSSRHILVEDCVFNPKVAHPIFIGLHGAASEGEDRTRIDTIEDLTFRRIRILNQHESQVDYQGCMAIVAGDNNVVRNILFEDITVEHIHRGSLLTLRIFRNEKYCQAPGTVIEDITFRRITAPDEGELSVIQGYSPDRPVRNITFDHLVIDGRHIHDTMPGKPRWYKTSDMCRFLVGPYVENLIFK